MFVQSIEICPYADIVATQDLFQQSSFQFIIIRLSRPCLEIRLEDIKNRLKTGPGIPQGACSSLVRSQDVADPAVLLP